MEKHGRIYKGFYIAPEQWLQLRIMSAIQKENVSVTLRRIIKEFLDRNQDQIKGGIEKNVNIYCKNVMLLSLYYYPNFDFAV